MRDKTIICQYDGSVAHLVDGSKIYPNRIDLRDKRFYRCPKCYAYVGCHKGTIEPMGILANAELRKAKLEAHAVFDPMWKENKWGNRKQSYAKLARKMGIPENECHIGMFDLEKCKKVIEAVRKA